jgi:hypothetical protein
MQLILFSKNSSNPSIPIIIDHDPRALIAVPVECTRQGTVCLISLSTYDTIKTVFAEYGYYDCGEKAKK